MVQHSLRMCVFINQSSGPDTHTELLVEQESICLLLVVCVLSTHCTVVLPCLCQQSGVGIHIVV